MLSKNQVSEIRALHQKKQRELRQEFIAEGVKTTLEILSFCPHLIRHIYGTADFAEQHKVLLSKHKTLCTTVTEAELQRISLQEKPNQALMVCAYLSEPDLKYDFTS